MAETTNAPFAAVPAPKGEKPPKIRFGVDRGGHQCGSCGAVFNSVGSFDMHRRAFQCLDPRESGLSVLRTTDYETNLGQLQFEIFGVPMSPERIEKLKGLKTSS